MNIFASLTCFLTVIWQPAAADDSASRRIAEVPAFPTRLDAPIVIGKFVPPEPLPSREIPAMRVEGAVTGEAGGKRLTILRGEPSTLPDIPRPVAPKPLTQEEIAARQALAANQPEIVTLLIGATVYGHQLSVVHWRSPGLPETHYEAVVGLDFGLFANVTSFTRKETPHHLMLMCTDVPAEALERSGDEVPQVEAGAYRVIQGNPADAAGMAPFIALMDLYAAEKDHLLTAHNARQKYFAVAEAYQKANPPSEPAQRTFWLRPHRGSRYLQEEGGDR